MLQKLREFSKSKASGVMLGLLSLAFVSWGVGDILRGGVSTAVAKVGGRSIDQEEFKRDYSNALKTLGRQTGTAVTPDMARRQGVPSSVLQQSIITGALDNVVDELGLTVSEATVTAQIRALPQFSGGTGMFDKNTFMRAINDFGYDERSFLMAMRDDLARGQLTETISAGFGLPAGYARLILAYFAEQRAAEYVVVDESVLPPVSAPDDATLSAYVKAHPERFSTPEYRDLVFVALTPEELTSKVTVTDEQLKQAYENAKRKYLIDEKRDVERLTFPDEAAAKAADAKLKAGTSFAAVAKAAGFDPADISLGEVAAADLDEASAKAVFAVQDGGSTEPVKSDFGWNLFHVTKITPAKVIPLEQAKAELMPLIVQQLARAKLDDIANAYNDAADRDGLSMAEAAKAVGLKVVRIAAMDKNGLTPDGSKAPVPDDAEFRAQVFNAEIGEEGIPAQSKAGVFYVVQVSGQTPPKLKPLAAVREAAIQAWTQDQKAMMLSARAADLTKDANARKALALVADAAHLKVLTSKALIRRSPDDVFSQAALDALFDAMPGQTVFAPLGKGKGYVVARVSGIAHRLPSEQSPMYVQAVKQLSGNVGEDLVTSFAAAARDAQGVTINQKLVDSVVGGEGQ